MTFDPSQLSKEPLPEEAQGAWGAEAEADEPFSGGAVPAAIYRCKFDLQTERCLSFDANEAGPALFIAVGNHVVVAGPNGDTDHKDRVAVFDDRVRGNPFTNQKSSLLAQMLAAGGIRQKFDNPAAQYQAVKRFSDEGKVYPVETEWSGECGFCRMKNLRQATGDERFQSNDKDERKAAFQAAQERADWKGRQGLDAKARKAGRKFRNMAAFPADASGNPKDFAECPTCGNEVQARGRRVRFIIGKA